MTRTLVIAAVLLVASQAGAVPRNTVKAHIDKATKAHKEGNFELALDELKAAYTLDPKPDLLFAIAQVYVKLDNCTDAVVYYEKFLAVAKNAKSKAVVTQAIETCKAKLEPKKVEPKKVEPVAPVPVAPVPVEPVVVAPPVEPKKPKVEPTPPSAAPPMERKDEPRAVTGSPWYKDPLGDVLVVGGVTAGVFAFVMRSGAQSEADKAAKSGVSEDSYRDHLDKSESKEKLSLILGVTAGVLTVGGVVRYVTRSSGKKQETRVGMTPARGGGFVTILGRF